MKRALQLVLPIACLALAGNASDEIQGSVADVLSAIKGRTVGKAYAVSVRIVVPPQTNDTRFVVRDRTGSVVIRRDLDWPEAGFQAGDRVMLRCEIGSTACTPAAAYFQGMTLLSRSPTSAEGHGSWLITAKADETAQVFKLPRFLTALNATIAMTALLVLFLAFVAWNTLLHRLVDRRSRELTDERLESFTSCLKVEERTRLAVELHDTIAQTLTGVALEIDAARDFAQSGHAEIRRHLDCAARTLSSCRNELRNCMWDLRNQTLDDVSMDTAIRRTLAPHLSGASLSVRFDVARDIFSDNTALAILRIMRELTLNAIRHGRASAVRIAGCIENGKLLFSVRDNGRGFDPAACPGVEQGHFGLQGVAERAEALGGALTVDSAPGKGTRIGISITLPDVKIPSA